MIVAKTPALSVAFQALFTRGLDAGRMQVRPSIRARRRQTRVDVLNAAFMLLGSEGGARLLSSGFVSFQCLCAVWFDG